MSEELPIIIDTPYVPGCAWNDWLRAIAEELKKNPNVRFEMTPPPAAKP